MVAGFDLTGTFSFGFDLFHAPLQRPTSLMFDVAQNWGIAHTFTSETTMLQKFSAFAGVPGPVVVIVMDGYGLPKLDVGSAIARA